MWTLFSTLVSRIADVSSAGEGTTTTAMASKARTTAPPTVSTFIHSYWPTGTICGKS